MAQAIIAIDMMGGDNAPESMMAGVAEALQRFGDTVRLLLVGDTPVLKEGLVALGVDIDDPRLEFHHSEQVVGMDEHPAQAVRSKRRSSICIAADLVKSGAAQGMFSIGNTGAAVGAAFLKWRMLPGISRPGIATVIPGEDNRWVLMDSGATVDCTAANLAQFAIMGSAYARHTLGIASPKVGLLSNGTEEGKGNRATQEAFQLISSIKDINFIGNVEGHDLFSSRVDVVVCDG
ncbi:MAG: phosphate acyltransferase, partial [Victivallales bacterium]|nr:phosphate acyltransferase [Victivallales bacterium]